MQTATRELPNSRGASQQAAVPVEAAEVVGRGVVLGVTVVVVATADRSERHTSEVQADKGRTRMQRTQAGGVASCGSLQATQGCGHGGRRSAGVDEQTRCIGAAGGPCATTHNLGQQAVIRRYLLSWLISGSTSPYHSI